nr:ferric reductase-like transmembrane domain-containing protein [Nonomuraea sp. FMUSA5-5]
MVYLVLVAQVGSGASAAVQAMPHLVHTGGVWAYSLSQAAGFAALVWAWLTTLLGLTVASRLCPRRVRAAVERIHRSTSLTVIALTLVHALALLWDKMGDTPLTVLVPGAQSYTPGRLPQSLGIIALYLAVIIGPSYYLRDRMGSRAWRLIHRFLVPAVYVLSVWHTLMYGSDVKLGNPLFLALWAMQIPVIGAFLTRLLTPARPGERLTRHFHPVRRRPPAGRRRPLMRGRRRHRHDPHRHTRASGCALSY